MFWGFLLLPSLLLCISSLSKSKKTWRVNVLKLESIICRLIAVACFGILLSLAGTLIVYEEMEKAGVFRFADWLMGK